MLKDGISSKAYGTRRTATATLRII